MIYKFCPPNAYSLENLQKRVLFCRHYSSFNDPFEFWSQIKTGVPRPSEVDRFRAAFATWGFPDIDVEDPPEDHQEYFDSLGDGQPDFQLLFDYTRIVCFGSDPSNLLMWSHYADGLRGFCIAFDETALLGQDNHDYLTKVDYLDTPPIVDSFVYAVAEDQYDYHLTEMGIDHLGKQETWVGEHDDYRKAAEDAFMLMKTIWRKAFAAKPLEWAYEGEMRLLVRTDDNGTSPLQRNYPVSAIKEIIVGERMDKSYRVLLNTIFEKYFKGVPVREARRSLFAYKLQIS